MTSFKVLWDGFTAIDQKDFNGYLLGKADTLVGYVEAIPRLKGILKGLFVKVAASDGVLDEGEIVCFDILKTIFNGERLDVPAFIAEMVQFVKDGSDASNEIAAYWMLPEYVRDDVVFFLLVLSSVDGDIAKEELDFIASLCE